MSESPESTQRPPFSLPNYEVGTEASPNHFQPNTTREEAAKQASALQVGDAAFIKRSDLKWTYALVTERTVGENGSVTLRFEVDAAKNRKSFPENQWGKYIRVIVVEEEKKAEVVAPAATTASVKSDVKSDAAAKTTANDDNKSVTSNQASVKSNKSNTKSIKSGKSKVASSDGSVKSGRGSVKGSVKGVFKSAIGAVSSPKPKADKKEADKKEADKKEESVAPVAAVEEKKMDAPAAKVEAEAVVEKKEEPVEAVAQESSAEVVATPAVAEKEETPKETAVAAPSAAPKETPAVKSEAQSTNQAEAKSSSSGWFSSFFGSNSNSAKPAEVPKTVVAEAKTATPAKTATTAPAETKEPAPAKPPTTPNPSVEVTAADERDDKSSKENIPEASDQLTLPKTYLPSPSTPKSPGGSLPLKRNPSNILKFKFGNKKSPTSPPLSPKAGILSNKSPPTSPLPLLGGINTPSPVATKKEWFDPEASECDYDKNPTDLFQALEAREFEYAFEMYEQTNEQFTKDCKTWVIAKGLTKGSALRFRALPLHAAIVFDAPDELIIKILRAYPKASRGRDVKGRLPIHLAFEHQTSDQVVALIIDAFPKGFFAADKKEMTPLDHINGNTSRSYMAKYIPQIIAAKVEEEREKWNVETNMLLEHQKATLSNDEEFMAEVIAHVQEEVEAHNMSKIELLEANYQKEIELLKKKHDSETQALLEGFEVKLNFERKLNKLKTKQ